jgi:cell wall-associated NlpC family hydrolase
MINPDDIIATARRLLGVPYRHLGRDMHGVDCLGVLIWTARELGIDPPEYDYTRNPSASRMRRLLGEHMHRIQITEAKPGDILHAAYRAMPQHLLILTTPTRVLHADSESGRVVEHVFAGPWPGRIRGAYRVIHG